MKLFGYYVCHTFKNQIKKLFKTWVLLFFVLCLVLGGLIGFGAASLEEMASSQSEETVEPDEPEESELSFEERTGITKMDMAELVVGGIVLAVLTVYAMGADKNGSKIFLPADVNLLFPSPMQPQSVLMFRLVTRMGMGVLGSAYLFMQIPTLVRNGVSLWRALSLIEMWCIALAMGSLLQTLLYVLCSTHPRLKSNLRRILFGILFVIGLGYFAYWKSTDYTPLQAAAAFFNHPISVYIPVWGWIKGVMLTAAADNVAGHFLCLGAILLGGLGIGYVIFHIRADFYEDALCKSQETAALMEAVQSEKTVVRKRKKDRSDKLRRDGFSRGWGASVFFHKTLYNRFRFAHFHVFTKTSETYLLTALFVAALCKYVIGTPGMMPVMLTLGGFSFFRAMANPLAEDTDRDFFRMIPESTWKKLFFSLLGGTVNCFLDLIPAILGACLLLWENPGMNLMWIPFILTVDFFSSTTGAFINLSVPVSAGKMIKQIVIAIFIYLGLVPDIGIMAVGIVTDHVFLAALGAVAVNLGLGFAFLGLTPLFIDPKDGKQKRVYKPVDLKQAKHRFNVMGLSLTAFLGVSILLQLGIREFFPQLVFDPIGFWIGSFAPMYLVGLPLCLLILRWVPKTPIPKKKLKTGHWGIAMIICIFLLAVGNLAGMLVLQLFQSLFGAVSGNPVEALTVNQPVLPRLLLGAIIGPLVEEYVFRKQLIDRMHPYGGKLAVVISAVLFGLFHGNFSQFFYAFTVGLAFGFIYLRTGKLRYSAIMHMIVNFSGMVLVPWILSHLSNLDLLNLSIAEGMAASPWITALVVYEIVILVLAVAGLFLLCANHRKIRFPQESLELAPGVKFKTVCLNAGTILIFILCAALTVRSFM